VPHLPDWLVNACQVVAVLALAPLVAGVIARLEAIVQMRRGPRLLQTTRGRASTSAPRRAPDRPLQPGHR
jgi:hypothetical protein